MLVLEVGDALELLDDLVVEQAGDGEALSGFEVDGAIDLARHDGWDELAAAAGRVAEVHGLDGRLDAVRAETTIAREQPRIVAGHVVTVVVERLDEWSAGMQALGGEERVGPRDVRLAS